LAGASTTRGESPWLPKRAMFRSDCSTLVGKPVDGPPRWTSTITSGTSAMTAQPSASLFREIPGPLEPVTATRPA